MIDTHCHLLPHLDDGPATVAEAVALGRSLAASGAEVVVCTPHWSRAFPTSHARSVAARDLLSAALLEANVRLELVVSAELSDVVAATRPIAEIRERSIDGRAVLVELISDSLVVHAAAVTRRLAAAGLSTILAHPERCVAVQRDPRVLDGLRDEGAYIQVVAPSLTGHRPTREHDTAWELLHGGRVDLVASDAHGAGLRPCQLAAAAELVTESFGLAAWRQLTLETPKRLLGRLDPASNGLLDLGVDS